MDLRHAIEHNARTGWLSRQPEAFRNRVAAQCNLRFLKAGERLTSLDDPPGGIHGLASGALNIYLASGPFPPFLCYIAYPGWWTGEAAAATRTGRRVEQVARLDCTVLFLPEAGLKKLAAEDSETWKRLEQITVSHMDNALGLASILAGSDKRLRVLGTLERLADQFEPCKQIITVVATQSDLAEMIGLTRNSIGPVLSDLAQDGIIRLNYGELEIDRKRLGAAIGSTQFPA